MLRRYRLKSREIEHLFHRIRDGLKKLDLLFAMFPRFKIGRITPFELCDES